MLTTANKLTNEVIRKGICTGCGACVALSSNKQAEMLAEKAGPVPSFPHEENLPEWTWDACPGKGINYPSLYQIQYGSYPDNWLVGHIEKARTGYSGNPDIRKAGASGGVITQVLLHLLKTKQIDGAILAKQGTPTPLEARAVICTTPEEILACAQSVYIPVSMLDILRDLPADKTYAITCLPEQSAALRMLQHQNFAPAKQIKYILGPYTGTALEPAAIDCYLRSNRVPKSDPVVSLKWRAGEWPGYLEIKTQEGRVLKSPKVYYNFLIPFFVTTTSLQSMDFANEFADLAVGDAWSPAFEKERGGHSVIVTRSAAMEAIIQEMIQQNLLDTEEIDPAKASDMHGHMIDFKKRGGYIRNRWKKAFGRKAPDYGMQPEDIPTGRYIAEMVISSLFFFARSRPFRFMLRLIPERIIGPVFNFARLRWKAISKPTKRKGLKNFKMKVLSDA